ncbi:hypothetical protein D3C78_1066340 [compost metagenome]
MITSIGVYNINGMNLIKIVLLSVSCEHARYTWIKSTTKQRGKACFFESFFVSPLPRVFKFRCILWFIIGSIHIVHSCCQARIHDCQVLIWESDINNDIRLKALDQFNDFVRIICIELSSRNLRAASG